MTPYNICENKWLSKAKDKAKKHYNDNKTLYIGYWYITIFAVVVLAILTALDSFL